MRAAFVAASVALTSLVFAPRAAALTQPNGAPVPSSMGCSGGKPTGLLPVLACACTQPGVCNIGAPCPGGSTSCDLGKNGTCEATLWHSVNDNSCVPSNHSGVDPATQAQVVPETFHPTCAQTFTVVSRGTAQFQNVFGWYNATTQAPAASDLHVMLACGDAAGKSVTLDLHGDPSYKGGDVGFFLITPEDHGKAGSCAGADCCPTAARLQAGQGYVYYSQRSLDPDPGYVHLLNLASAIAPNRFYFAWEDTFDTTSADFTDLVASVDGVQCSGAGQICDTGKQGVCKEGITECAGGGDSPSCQPLLQPHPEACNGLDDDCNGTVDDGATCPVAGDVCVNGQCVAHCGSAENQCSAPLACDEKSGECVDAKCVGVSCAADQVCRGGTCAAACDGVVCPHGQTCVGDACEDLCKGVSCATGQTCIEGACLPSCNACGGATCAAPLQCDATSGACVDPSCAQPCPGGTFCQAGQCVDACQGVKCPGGGTCAAGQCSGTGTGASDAGTPSLTNPPPAAGGSAGASGDVDGGAGNADSPGFGSTPRAGCACTDAGVPPASAATSRDAAAAFFALVALGALTTRRRRVSGD
jgi:hypothetical protein